MKFSLISFLLVIFSSFICCKDVNTASATDGEPGGGKKKEKKKKDNDKKNTAADITIISSWDLPEELKEVSGIAYLDNNRFACVQDEKGIVYIYNGASKSIEKKIPFAGPGDYEAIAVNGNTAYVASAYGEVFEVNMDGGNNKAKKYTTPLTANHDVEGLCFDIKNNRLLVTVKNGEPGNKDYKGIYAFDLASKSLVKDPVYKIAMNDARLTDGKGKKNNVMPSEIGIHPLTNEFYITDGPNARLLILSSKGEVSRLLELGKSFEQPEGISFSPQGEIFISNEGNKKPGNIIKVKVG